MKLHKTSSVNFLPLWAARGLHLTFWVATTWLFTNSFSVQMRQLLLIDGVQTVNIIRNNGLLFQVLACVAVGAVVFYLTIWLLSKHNLFTHYLSDTSEVSDKFFAHHLSDTSEVSDKFSIILWLVLIFGIGILLAYVATVVEFGEPHPPLPLAVAWGMVTFYFAIAITYSIAKLLYRNNQRQQQLILDKKQTELTLLRNQLQPHFLFNALNNLLAMVQPNENPKLVHSFERLSQLLRYVIEETQAEKVSIRKEIVFLENYIALQKLRFTEEEVLVNLQIEGQFIDQPIEAGLYVAFVENAFKYGTEPEQISQIAIYFDLTKENQINFTIKNKIMMPNLTGNKTGIANTRKRLELIYPNKYELQIEQTEEFVVGLTIQTK